ncbi:MAG TPA: isochorismatase family cysteine hydrolase [Dissulfurispiraceae bacterium]
MAKEALLVIDMLNDFVREEAPLEVPAAREVIPAIQREIAAARREDRPVVYVCDSHTPDDREFTKFGWPRHAVRGTEGAKIIDELAPMPGDVVVEKTTYSGFYHTGLDGILRELGVDSLRLTGCVTHICILFTAADAVLRDYKVAVPGDAVAPLAREDHDAALRIMKNVLGVKVILPSPVSSQVQ